MALLKGLVRSFVALDRIKTTETRAKEVRPMAEKLITRARKNDLHARRMTRRILTMRIW
jgi:large subunit ribosomal protein L17